VRSPGGSLPAPALPATIPALLLARAAEFAATALFTCEEERLSFAEAERRSAVLAKGLLALGAHKGTRVGLLYPNGSDFVVAFLAITRIGAWAIPFSTLSTSEELGWLLAHADVEILLSADKYRSREFPRVLEDAIPELDFDQRTPLFSARAPSLRRIFFRDIPGHPDFSIATLARVAVSDALLEAAQRDVCASDTAIVVHTSGSMSVPKGVVHTHGALVDHIRHLNAIRKLTPAEILFSNSPFFWIGGLVFSLLGALEAGARLVCATGYSSAAALDLIERERPTIINGFAQSIAHLTKDPSYPHRDFSSARRGNMPAIMSPDVRPDDTELRHNMLGMTETASVYLTHEDMGPLPEQLRGSFGKPTPNFELRIVDPVTNAEVPVGGVGEIRLRGPYVMDGYLGKERHDVFDPDGWYHTGDLAAANEDGYIFYKGRLGDMIKTSGANVSPSEVEKVLTEITGRRAHVMGVADKERGQIVVAALVTDGTLEIDETELREQLKRRISSYKIPRRFLFLKETDVPMMSSGKLDKRRLAELFSSGL
jgi:acyl-CoA synthetase (AMP-forming)/AMP-acid ligase II